MTALVSIRGLQCLLPYTSQDHLPKSGTHSGLSTPTTLRKCTTGLSVGQDDGGISSTEVPFYRMTLACVKPK